MLIIAVELAGLKIPLVIAPTTTRHVGNHQWESARNRPPTANETIMKITFRMVAAIAVGTMILVSAAADADTRPGISPGEAKRLRYQVQQYHQMQRHVRADGLITRAEQARLNHKAGQLRRLIQIAKTN